MKILLIGNFAPPFEEENLQNITLFNRLVEDGHECSAINISKNPATDSRFFNPGSNAGYLLTLIRLGRKQDVIHFSTKGYLRVGLLKMMLSIFVAKVTGAKSVITFYSEFFSILGQMRSPFGGTQTLFTSFYLADRIIFSDKDTFEVATMYRKRPNFELLPSFIHVPENMPQGDSSLSGRLKDKKNVIVFTNVTQSAFIAEILRELLAASDLSEDTAIVISSSGEAVASSMKIPDNLIFIDQEDLHSALTAFSSADIILRPLTCDGEMFFEKFTVSAKKVLHAGNNVFFPNGLVFIKEGTAAALCADMIRSMLSSGGPLAGSYSQDPYNSIKAIYG